MVAEPVVTDLVSAARPLAALCAVGDGPLSTTGLQPSDLRAVAPLAVLLVRSGMIWSTPLTVAESRRPHPSAAITFLGELSDAAGNASDHALAQLLDWAFQVWTGGQHNRAFFVGKHLPDRTYDQLNQVTTGSSALLRATGRRVLDERISALGTAVEQRSAIDRVLCRALFVDPVGDVVHGIQSGKLTDGGLLAHDSATLLARANADRRVPTNGRRWPLLLRAIEAIRDDVDELLQLARFVQGGETSIPEPETESLESDLVPVLQAALCTDPDPDVPLDESGISELGMAIDATIELMADADPRAVFTLIGLASSAGVVTDQCSALLAPFEAVRARVEALLCRVPSDAESVVRELHEMVIHALETGQLADAETALALGEEECDRAVLEARVSQLGHLVENVLSDAELAKSVRYLRAARAHIADGEFEEAEDFVVDVELVIASHQQARSQSKRVVEPTSSSSAVAADNLVAASGLEPERAEVEETASLEFEETSANAVVVEDVEAAAKRLYGEGREDEAIRTLRILIRQNPKSPGIYLLLRIYRERNELDPAVKVIEEIAKRHATSWRHHIELARNALYAGAKDLAWENLALAERMGAEQAWLAPLASRLRVEATASQETEPIESTAEPVDELMLIRGLRTRTTDRAAWSRAIVGIVQSNDSDRVIRMTQAAISVVPWAMTVLVRAISASENVELIKKAAGDLVSLAAASRDEPAANVDLALLLTSAGCAAEALAVLVEAEKYVHPRQLPRIWFCQCEALRAAGRETDADELARRTRPPLPNLDDARSDLDPRSVPECHMHRIGGAVAAVASIQEGQRLLDRGLPGEAADFLVIAVREGHAIALASALGALVLADRSAAALQLYSEMYDQVWIGAASMWNIGCAYARQGFLGLAVQTFRRHAVVNLHAYSPEQRQSLASLFNAAGQALPDVARARPSDVQSGMDKALAAARLGRDSRSFVLASRAVREAMAGAEPATIERLLNEVEDLFDRLQEKDSVAAGELIRVLSSGPRRERAWSLVMEWIETYRAASPLLAPAVDLARTIGKAGELRSRIESVPDDNSSERYLSLAKLARHEGDEAGVRKYAAQAKEINPTSGEATELLRVRRAVTAARNAVPPELMAEIKDHSDDRARVVALLTRRYGPVLDSLSEYALRLLGPNVDPSTALYELDPESAAPVKAALAAAADEEWESAVVNFQVALDSHPRHLGIASNTVACLIRVERYAAAKAICQTIAYAPSGLDAMAKVAFAERDFEHAAEKLAERADRKPFTAEQVLGHAGLLFEYCKRIRDAAEVLLSSAERMLPGRPHSHAALALLLAARCNAVDLHERALRVLFAQALNSRTATQWAIKNGALERLREPDAPRLNHVDLKKLKSHFGGRDRERFRAFLRSKRNRVFLEALAELEEEDGRIVEAFDAHWLLLRFEYNDALTILSNVLRFCERVGYLEGYRRTLRYKVELGQQITYRESRNLEEWEDSAELRLRKLRNDIRAALWQVEHLDLATKRQEVGEQLDVLAGHLRALTEGGADKTTIDLLAGSWNDVIEVLVLLGSGGGESSHAATAADILQRMKLRYAGLGNELAREAVGAVNHYLYKFWEQLARDGYVDESDAPALVDLRVERAHRLSGGPVELVVRLTARISLTGVRIQVGGGHLTLIDLVGQVTTDVDIIVDDSESVDLEVDVSYLGLMGPESRSVRCVVKELSSAEAEFRSRFTPNVPAAEAMFVGRQIELSLLRSYYEALPRHGVTVRFLEGPREVGKTSLARMLIGRGDDPESWPIPGVLVVYVDSEKVDLSDKQLLEHVAHDVENRVTELWPDAPVAENVSSVRPISSAGDFERFWQAVRASVPCDIGLLVAVDEFQYLLRVLNDSGTLVPAISALRSLANNGTLGLLFCGSCTLRSIELRLRGTTMAKEITAEPVGFLGKFETIELFQQGFDGFVHVMRDALDEVWRLSGGYPNHIHLIGDKINSELRRGRRRLLNIELVRKVAYELGRSSGIVHGIIKPEDESESGVDLLLALFDPDDTVIDPELCERLSVDEREQLDRYISLGLLRQEQQDLKWANELMHIWLQTVSRGRTSKSPVSDRGPGEHALLSAGFTVLRRWEDSLGTTCVVERDGRRFDARLFEIAGDTDPKDSLHILETLFTDCAGGQALDGFPEYVARVDDWLVFDSVGGSSLRDRLRIHPDQPVEPERAAGWIVSACDILYQVADRWNLTHGNLEPSNILTCGAQKWVVGWGCGARNRDGESPLPLAPKDFAYVSPQYLQRIEADSGGATESDDVYALGVILYQFLHPDAALPYGAIPVDPDGPVQVPPPGMADEGLRACVLKAIAIRAEDRYRTPKDLATALRAAVPSLQESIKSIPLPAAGVHESAGMPFNVHIENKIAGGRYVEKDQSIKVEGSVSNSVVGHRNRIRQSLNHAANGDVESEVKQRLAELGAMIEGLIENLDPDDVEAVTRDFESFEREATAHKPRGSALARVGEGIVEVASRMTEFAAPILDLVQRIVGMFS